MIRPRPAMWRSQRPNVSLVCEPPSLKVTEGIQTSCGKDCWLFMLIGARSGALCAFSRPGPTSALLRRLLSRYRRPAVGGPAASTFMISMWCYGVDAMASLSSLARTRRTLCDLATRKNGGESAHSQPICQLGGDRSWRQLEAAGGSWRRCWSHHRDTEFM